MPRVTNHIHASDGSAVTTTTTIQTTAAGLGSRRNQQKRERKKRRVREMREKLAAFFSSSPSSSSPRAPSSHSATDGMPPPPRPPPCSLAAAAVFAPFFDPGTPVALGTLQQLAADMQVPGVHLTAADRRRWNDMVSEATALVVAGGADHGELLRWLGLRVPAV